jgi:hypothetical protein
MVPMAGYTLHRDNYKVSLLARYEPINDDPNVVFVFSIVAKKVFLDQTGLTIPILFVFFTTMSFLEGKDDITADFLEKFPVTFAVGTDLYLTIKC